MTAEISRTRLVVATDVRFWRRETGAQQRIAELVKYLGEHAFDVTTLFLGPIAGTTTANDRLLIAAARLEVISLVEDWFPQGWWDSFRWRCNCIFDALRQRWNRNNAQLSSADPIKRIRSKRLSEFRSTEFQRRFRSSVARLQPHAVIVEYITLSYLVPDRSQRAGVLYAVDTHDVLSMRNQQFKQHRYEHWVELSRSEEAAAIDSFDVVIAIQPEEAAIFRSFVSQDQPVIVAGMAGQVYQVDVDNRRTRRPADPISIGILASNNAANQHALSWFLDEVWPILLASHDTLRLVVAGSITKSLAGERPLDRVQILGPVQKVADFYALVDIVVNPIQFGTGLKIKNIEAMCFGKPLVTTKQGTAGSEQTVGTDYPWLVANTADEMAQQLLQLSCDKNLRERLTRSAQQYVNSELQADKTYRELIAALSSCQKNHPIS